MIKCFITSLSDSHGVQVHKLAQNERSQHPAILTDQTWEVKDLIQDFRENVLAGYSGPGSPERAR